MLSSIGNLVLLGDFRVLRLQPGHKFCLLGRLSTEVGWHHYDTIKVCFDTPENLYEVTNRCVHWKPRNIVEEQ
jgi:hypothetical protein